VENREIGEIVPKGQRHKAGTAKNFELPIIFL